MEVDKVRMARKEAIQLLVCDSVGKPCNYLYLGILFPSICHILKAFVWLIFFLTPGSLLAQGIVLSLAVQAPTLKRIWNSLL